MLLKRQPNLSEATGLRSKKSSPVLGHCGHAHMNF